MSIDRLRSLSLHLFPIIAGLPTIACSFYCLRIWAPMQDEFSWLNLDISIVCWTFCSTGIFLLAYLAMAIGFLSVVSGILLRRVRLSRYLLAMTGLLLFPLGLLNFWVLWKSR